MSTRTAATPASTIDELRSIKEKINKAVEEALKGTGIEIERFRGLINTTLDGVEFSEKLNVNLLVTQLSQAIVDVIRQMQEGMMQALGIDLSEEKRIRKRIESMKPAVMETMRKFFTHPRSPNFGSGAIQPKSFEISDEILETLAVFYITMYYINGINKNDEFDGRVGLQKKWRFIGFLLKNEGKELSTEEIAESLGHTPSACASQLNALKKLLPNQENNFPYQVVGDKNSGWKMIRAE